MELNIGTNIFRNTNGIVKLQGKEQVFLEVHAEAPALVLTIDLYDPHGSHIAHLRRNKWAFNQKNRFDLQTSTTLALFTYPVSLRILDKETGDTVLDVNLIKEDTVQILQGKFLTHKGQLFEITPHFWRLAGVPTMFGSVQDNRGSAVTIG
jgi:hypothetical protein